MNADRRETRALVVEFHLKVNPAFPRHRDALQPPDQEALSRGNGCDRHGSLRPPMHGRVSRGIPPASRRTTGADKDGMKPAGTKMIKSKRVSPTYLLACLHWGDALCFVCTEGGSVTCDNLLAFLLQLPPGREATDEHLICMSLRPLIFAHPASSAPSSRIPTQRLRSIHARAILPAFFGPVGQFA